jgi:hypothetical protein
MSNRIDPLKDVFHLSGQERQALQTAASIIGSVSSVWGTVSGTVNTVKSVLTALGVLSGDQTDQVAEMRHSQRPSRYPAILRDTSSLEIKE